MVLIRKDKKEAWTVENEGYSVILKRDGQSVFAAHFTESGVVFRWSRSDDGFNIPIVPARLLIEALQEQMDDLYEWAVLSRIREVVRRHAEKKRSGR